MEVLALLAILSLLYVYAGYVCFAFFVHHLELLRVFDRLAKYYDPAYSLNVPKAPERWAFVVAWPVVMVSFLKER